MKLRFLGKNSTVGDCPTLYATDRDTYLVQGWKIFANDLLMQLEIPEGETAVEVAAALAAGAVARGDQFGFACRDGSVGPGSGQGQLEAVLDVLARVNMGFGGGVQLPASAGECILVTASPSPPAGFGDTYAVWEPPDADR